MKRILILSLASLFYTGAAMADPALGLWKTEVDDGAYAHVEISPCGANVCGTIVKTFNDSGEYN